MKPLSFGSINCPTGNCRTNVFLWAQKSVDITDLDIQDSGHPNLSPFKGTLLLLDEPSTQPPHGSDGHRIFVPTRVAEKRLDTLPGMAVNYQNDLEGHNPAKKIGVITKASIEGKKVKVEGVIWRKDFPEALRTFRMNKGRLGMSMELGDVYVRDKDEEVWHLEDFHFTGATVLKKDYAAYEHTELAASKQRFVKALAAARSAVDVIQRKGGKPEMADDKKKKSQGQGQALVVALSAAVSKSLEGSFKTYMDEQRKINERTFAVLDNISASQEELAKGFNEMASESVSAEAEEVEEEAEEVDIEAGGAITDATMASGKDDPSSEDDATDPSDASEVDAGIDPTNFTSSEQGDDAEPGNLNDDASANYREQSKGPASSRIQKTGKTGPSRGIAASKEKDKKKGGVLVARSMAAARVIRTQAIEIKGLRAEKQRFMNRVAALEASVSRYAERVERRTITPEVASLLEKGGHDVRELMASKVRLTVSEVDDLFLKSNIQLEPAMRAAFKNQLLQAGLMEQGEVRRWGAN